MAEADGTIEDIPDDIARLRAEFPDGWAFGTVWASAATGPDVRRLWAVKDGFLFSAWTAADLAGQIRRQVMP